jgi:FkbM family methyltransferase
MKQLLLKAASTAGRALRRTPIARWRWLNHLHARMAHRLASSDDIAVGEFRVCADRRDEMITKKLILYGAFEQREIDLLCSFVRPGDVALDVGANIGLYSLALSRAVGPEGRVIAVEPDPDNLKLLRRNLARNGCANVIVVDQALGDRTGVVNLYQHPTNRGMLSTADIFGLGEEAAIPVPMQRADEVFTELGLTPRVAKIDVEGQEPLVIAGMGEHLPEVLQFELALSHLRCAGHDPQRFLAHLRSLAYSLSLHDGETAELSVDQLLERAEHAELSNVLALRTAPSSSH